MSTCESYATKWKISFNPTKSRIYCTNNSKLDRADFELSGGKLMKVNSFIYLGLPIGDAKFISEVVGKKFSNVEKAFFAIRNIGLHRGLMNPATLGFIYRQYCQSICAYGLELITINKGQLHRLNTRQNNLLKLGVGISKFSKSSILLKAIGVLSISELYHKSKIQFLEQVKKNGLVSEIFDRLIYKGVKKRGCRQSFFYQISELENFLNKDPLIIKKDERWSLFNKATETPDSVKGLVDSVVTVIRRWNQCSWARQQLAQLLRVEFGVWNRALTDLAANGEPTRFGGSLDLVGLLGNSQDEVLDDEMSSLIS